MLVDSHCHLADEAFADDLPAVVDRARAAGVESALCMLDAGNADEQARGALVSGIWPAARFAIGVHPHQAAAYTGKAFEAVREIERATTSGRQNICAVGEIGLDYHYDFAPPEVQRDVLAAQVEFASRRNLPIVIHAREAEADVLDVVRAAARGPIRGVFHCYTGDAGTARRVLEAGFLVGIGGIVTFPQGENVRDLLTIVPLERVLVETDSPFLAPVPYRGKRNEPAWVVRVAETIAEVLDLDVGAVAGRTTQNFHGLFSTRERA
jgi:TatD DNase family protein